SVPAQYKTPDGYSLGGWVSRQRLSQDKLSDERKARLDALGFDWDPLTAQWEEGLEHLQAYIKKHGHCRVPQRYKSSDGYPLGSWLSRRRLTKNDLSPNQIEALDRLGFDWDPIATKWDEGVEHLEAYVKEHKHCRVPQLYKSPDGYPLGAWVSNTRNKPSRVSPERKAQLDALGFDWEPHDTSCATGLDHFRDFVHKHNHGRVFANYRSTDAYLLGAWVAHQRYTSISLSPERKARLDALRFDWDPLTAQWEEGLEHLQAYIKKHGHCRVPQQYKSLDGYKLGAWVLRRRHSKDTLSPKQIEVLDKLGFDWDPRTRHWE